MSTLVELGFRADSSDLIRARRNMDSLTGSGGRADSSTRTLTGSFKALAATLGTVVTAYASMSKITDITRQFDVLNSQLITATGSAENAAIAFQAIQKFAATTPYDLAQSTRAFTQLVNLGLTPSEAALRSYGNTASAMGKDLSQLVEAVADAATGEFERLKEFGIKAKSEGDNVSFTFRGVKTTVKKEASEIESYLMALGENEFAGAMAVRAKTLDGAISNLGDTWDSLFLTISKQGVGDLIQDSVLVASGAIEDLDNYIASGAFTSSLKAVVGRFDGFVSDINYTMNFVEDIIGNSADRWIDDSNRFFKNMKAGLSVLPEMTRFYIQAAGVTVAKLVDYAEIYGQAFVDVMKLHLGQVGDQADIVGKKLANALNPFSESFNYEEARAEIIKELEAQKAEVFRNADEQAERLSQVAESVILDYALQSVAAKESADLQIAESDRLLQAFLDRNKAVSNDSLAQFKITPTSSTGGSKTGASVTSEMSDYSKWIEDVTGESTIAKLQSIQDEITKTWLALDGGDLDKSAAMEHIDELEKRAQELKGTLTGSDMFASISDSAVSGLKSIQGLSAQGSKEYAKLGVAIQSVTAAQAVSAVINQATGDPYTAFARMAAMVSAVAALGVSVGGISGGFQDDSAANQEAQGLDVWGDKSDSISAAIDITANATDQLVGINTNMLSALQTMSDSISSAIAISLRGGLLESPEVDVYSNVFREMGGIVGSLFGTITDVFESSIMKIFSPITSIFLGAFDFIGGWLGGSSKTTDQGLQIVGGTLAELASDADINAYVDTKYKKWRFGSTKRRTDYADLDDASAQFTLVFASLADSVYEGAVSLGFGTAEITDAVNNFRIKTQEISLKGLSADAQQTAIENVFSSIFDSLALSVVSFLPDFQKVGEGYGETLARVANEVAVAEVIVDSLGVTIGDKLANPKMYVTIATNLSTLVGGLEEFASKTASFIDNFAPDSVKLGIYTDAMKESLESVGLSLPDTTEGFYNLMSGLDGTTDAGQNQIATLLSLTETADDYYSLLDNTVGSFNESLLSLSESILSTIDGMFGIAYDDALTSLDDALMLARAGSFDAALGLNLNSTQGNQSDFSSLADFNIAQAKTGNKLAELASLTGSTKTTADFALNESIEQTSLLKALKEQSAKMEEAMQSVVQSTKQTTQKLLEMQLDSLPVRIVT